MSASVVELNSATRSRTVRRRASRSASSITLRSATPDEAIRLHELVALHAEEGHLLPRSLEELQIRAARFVVAVRRGRIVGCAELASLSGAVAEVRSLVVDRGARDLGIGLRLVNEVQRRARLEGFDRLCAFTHEPGYFVRMGFSIVPHTWVPEKIAQDCHACPLFRRCGQHAVVLDLHREARPRPSTGLVPLASLRA
jgi:amino-acid N-acetyltransferase